MALKPLKVKGSHPDQKKGVTANDVKTHAAVFPRAFEEGRQLGGKALDKPEDLRGPSLDDSHRAGYSSNSGTTPSQEQATVKHTAKIGPKQAPRPAAPAHKGAPPKTAVRKSGRTAPAANPPQPAGRHRL